MKKTLLAAVILLSFVLCSSAQENKIFDIIKKGTVEELQKYLDETPGAIKFRDSEGTLTLQIAVRIKNNKMAKLLFKHGADPTITGGKHGTNAMVDALNNKNEEMIEWFFIKGVDINYIMHWAYEKYSFEEPFFFRVFRQGSLDLLKFMIDRGVDVNSTDESGRNCFSYCHISDLNSENSEILGKINLIIDAGADLSHPHAQLLLIEYISAPTKTMSSQMKLKINEAAKLLITKGVDINFQDEEGWTALHCAVWFDNKEVLKILLDAGANPDLEQRKGEKPIDFAKRLKRTEMIKLLKQANKS